MSNENPRIARDIKERAERKELFKQVAIAVLSSRPAGVLKGSVDGTILTPQFVEDVSLITEGILSAAKTFGEK